MEKREFSSPSNGHFVLAFCLRSPTFVETKSLTLVMRSTLSFTTLEIGETIESVDNAQSEYRSEDDGSGWGDWEVEDDGIDAATVEELPENSPVWLEYYIQHFLITYI